MKKSTRIFAIILCLIMSIATLVACDNDDGPNNVDIDTTKTQLYVYSTNAGYKVEWLTAAIKEYEQINAEKSFEEGKKGVQVIPYTPRSWPTAAAIKDDKINEVWFLEGISYRSYANDGIIADITDAFTKANPYEESGAKYQTVESRLDEQSKSVLNMDGKYYGVPFFHGSYGFSYNVEVFDKYGWYFATDGSIIGTNKTKTKSAGPNGNAGDYDDGLPATYDQFFQLCDRISSQGKIPVAWPGASYKMFLRELLQSLICDYEGYENMYSSFHFTGEQLLAKIENGQLVYDDAKTTISDENGYEIFRQAGIYYALKFVDKLIHTDAYHNEEAFDLSYEMTDAQDDFLLNAQEGREEIAMLLDGDWWMQEASETFKESEYDQNDFRRMPMPKATEEKIGEDICTFENGVGFMFVSANTKAEKMPLAIDFVQFMNSSKMLSDYTKITNTIRPINYDMSETDYASLSEYAKSLYDVKLGEGSSMIRYISKSNYYYKNEGLLGFQTVFTAPFNGTNYDVAEALHKSSTTGATPETFFTSLYNYLKTTLR